MARNLVTKAFCQLFGGAIPMVELLILLSALPRRLIRAFTFVFDIQKLTLLFTEGSYEGQ